MPSDEVKALLDLFRREFGNLPNAPIIKVGTLSAYVAGQATVTWATATDDPDPPDPTPGIPWLSSYTPKTTDKVYVLVAGGAPVILGSATQDWPQHGTQAFSLSAAPSVTQAVTWGVPYLATPTKIGVSIEIGSNLDIIPNIVTKSATGCTVRCFNRALANVTGSGLIHWDTWGI